MPVAVPTYDQAYGGLASAYDPQTSLVNQQVAALAPQEQAVQASLDQAKVNAFKDIGTSANAKGMLFSGFTPDQQAQYVGTKYLPAVAQNKTNFQNQRFSLQDKINQINANRQNQANGIVSDAQKQAAAEANAQAQLQLQYYKVNASNSRASAAAAAKPLSQTQTAAAIRQGLLGVKGGDGHVAPGDLAMAYKDWTGSGFAPAGFWKYFQGFWNPNQSTYGQQFHAKLGG